MFAGDRAHRIDVLVDQLDRDARQLGAMFEQPAQALGDAGSFGITERGRLALDVVSGMEQRFVRLLGKAAALDVLTRRFEALAFGLHPVGKLGRKLHHRRFGARDGVVVGVQRRPDGLAQLVRRRDHFVICESRNRGRVVLAGRHRDYTPDVRSRPWLCRAAAVGARFPPCRPCVVPGRHSSG